MKISSDSDVVFKEYNQDQLMLLPPSLEELIPDNHLVRVINAAIERLDIQPLLSSYKGGGTSSYHPKMMLKILVYAYCERIYSSRQIAKALRENIHFMWLSAFNRPDFRTINRFRSARLKGLIEDVFASVVELLLEEGYIDFRTYFLDGTKLEANANKYSWVWGKSTRKYKARLQGQIRDLLAHIDSVNETEEARYGDKDLSELGADATLTSEKLEQKVRELDQRLSEHPDDKDLKRHIKKLKDDYLPRTKKYEEQESKLGDRNSYSKTDHDATFMRMKDDHMRNGQLKPGYNIQTGTENQFIVGWSIHQKTTDTSLMIPHLKAMESRFGRLPENVVTDAGYGSEENYDFIEKRGMGNYVKFNYFHYEQKRSFKKAIFRVENLPYDAERDEFTCPDGQKLRYQYTSQYTTDNGYESYRKIYEAERCDGCTLRAQCHGSKYNRRVQVSDRLNRYKDTVRANLTSSQGLRFRSRRGVEVESVFAQIKHNRGFRRFMLRGLEKVKIEWGLLAIAHNMKKMAVA